jgi:hypothetical protein
VLSHHAQEGHGNLLPRPRRNRNQGATWTVAGKRVAWERPRKKRPEFIRRAAEGLPWVVSWSLAATAPVSGRSTVWRLRATVRVGSVLGANHLKGKGKTKDE